MSEAAISMVIGDAIDPEKAKADARTARAFRAKAVQLAAWADRRVVNRRSAHGHYIAPESRRDPDLTAYTDKTPVTIGTLVEHFKAAAQGDIRGLHATARDEAGGPGEVAACWSLWGAKDIDRHAEGTDPGATLKAALAWYDRAVGLGFRPLLEDSDGRGGFHLWVLFDGPTPTAHVFRFLLWLGRDWKALGLDKEAESFPKQPAIEAGGYGNWLRLFGRHHTRAHWSRFWSGERWLDGQEAVDFIAGIAGDSASLIPAEALVDPKPSRRAGATAKFTGEGDEAIAADALGYLDPTPYDDWIRYGMALHSRFGPSGLALWDHWSRGADNYDPGACERKWGSFNPNGGVKLGTLLAEAKQRGWPGQKMAEGRKATTALRLVGADHPADSDQPLDPTDERPTIVVDTEEMQVNDAAIDALGRDPELFCFGYVLATVIHGEPGKPPRKIEQPDGPPPRLNPLEPATLRERLANAASWVVARKDKKGDEKLDPTHPPAWSVAAVHARGFWPKIRPVIGVIESPTMRPDGSILSTAGYDPATCLYLHPNDDFPAIPERPTRDDARRAAGSLLDLVADFPLMEGHSSSWLSALLTVVGRAAIDENPTPLFAFDGNGPGAGKTLLADLIALIATARRMARTIWPMGREADEEVRKRITSLLLVGERMTLLDNIALGHALGGAPLDALLTSTTWKDRILGKSQSTSDLPSHLVTFATGVNLTFKTDIHRRVIPARIVSLEERPEERTDFVHPDLIGHVKANRPRYLVDALTVLRAYHVAGRPDPVKPLGSYEAWSAIVASAVQWSTGFNPIASRSLIAADDVDTQRRHGLFEGLAELPGIRGGLTASEIRSKVLEGLERRPDADFTVLRDALLEFSRNEELPSPRAIGNHLRSLKDRVVGGRRLTSEEDSHSKVARWRLIESAGSAGSCGVRGGDFAGELNSSSLEATGTHTANGQRPQPTPQHPADPATPGRGIIEL